MASEKLPATVVAGEGTVKRKCCAMLPALYTLLLVLSLFCSSIAMFGPAGIVVFCFCALMVVFLRWFKSILEAIISCAVIAVLLLLLQPQTTGSFRSWSRLHCRGNLKQIGLALHNYRQHYNCFPPASLLDENGKPIHSWRVLILPFLDQNTLYKSYDFNEPWDGPHNNKLLTRCPTIYVCRSDEATIKEDTVYASYVAMVGPGTAWFRLSNGESIEDDPDMAGNSILLAETVDANIGWTEPKDLHVEELYAQGKPKITSKHMRGNGFFYHDSFDGVHVVLGDGKAWFLPAWALKSDRLKDLLSAGGYNEKVISSIDTSENLRIHWPHCIGLAGWIVSLVLLLHWAVRCRKGTKTHAAEPLAT